METCIQKLWVPRVGAYCEVVEAYIQRLWVERLVQTRGIVGAQKTSSGAPPLCELEQACGDLALEIVGAYLERLLWKRAVTFSWSTLLELILVVPTLTLTHCHSKDSVGLGSSSNKPQRTLAVCQG